MGTDPESEPETVAGGDECPEDRLTSSRRGFLLAAGPVAAVGCAGRVAGGQGRSATLVVDGARAVRPVSDAAARGVGDADAGARIDVGASGTEEGFRRFAAGRADVLVASRPLTPEERARAAAKDDAYEERAVAVDVASMASEGWHECLDRGRVAEIRRGGDDVATWSELGGEATPLGRSRSSGSVPEIRRKLRPARSGPAIVRGTRSHQYAIGHGGLGSYAVDAAALEAAPDGRVDDSGRVPLVRVSFLYARRGSPHAEAIRAFVRRYESLGRALSGGAERSPGPIPA